MKKFKQLLLIVLTVIVFAVMIALPFGVKILREEGFDGIWKRKRANIERVMPEASPVLDKAEKSLRSAGTAK